MKETLHNFFYKTAYSKEASEHLLRFHSISKERFLLILPMKLEKPADLESFIADLNYLSQLDLHPTLLLSQDYLNAKQIAAIKSKSPKSIDIIDHNSEQDLIEQLKDIAQKRDFYKYMLIHSPLKDNSGEEYNQIHLNNCNISWDTSSGKLTEWLSEFLTHMGPAYSFQVTTPINLLPELFTATGAGTFVSLGYNFHRLQAESVSQEKLFNLIETGFNRKLKTDYLNKDMPSWFTMIEEQYRGAIVIIDYKDFFYLDKIVVTPEFFGRGLGSLLFDELFEQLLELSQNRPKLAWRAKHDNPYLNRYASFVRQAAKQFPLQCGTSSDEKYVYHYLGLSEEERLKAFQTMRNKKSSFQEE